MTLIDGALGLLVLILLLVFFERRSKAAYHHELTKIGMAKSRADELVKNLEELHNKTQELIVGEDRRNAALKTFLESWNDSIKFSEEERRNLRNKLQAKKLDGKV